MFTHKMTGVEDHKHTTVDEARICEEEYYTTPYDEDGQIAMMRILETDEQQRYETEREEQMVLAIYGALPNHREMTRQELYAYREQVDLRKAPPASRRLHRIDETCNCPNSYSQCHLYQNAKERV